VGPVKYYVEVMYGQHVDDELRAHLDDAFDLIVEAFAVAPVGVAVAVAVGDQVALNVVDKPPVVQVPSSAWYLCAALEQTVVYDWPDMWHTAVYTLVGDG
jgi:hypothetical protein